MYSLIVAGVACMIKRIAFKNIRYGRRLDPKIMTVKRLCDGSEQAIK